MDLTDQIQKCVHEFKADLLPLLREQLYQQVVKKLNETKPRKRRK